MERQFARTAFPANTTIISTATAQSVVFNSYLSVPQSLILLATGSAVDIKIEYAITLNEGDTIPAAAFGDNADVVANYTITARYGRVSMPAINSPFFGLLITGNAGNGADTVIVEAKLWAAEVD